MKAKYESEQEIKRFNVKGEDAKWNDYWESFTTDYLYSEIYEVLSDKIKERENNEELKLLFNAFNQNMKSFLITKNERGQPKNKVNEVSDMIEFLCTNSKQDEHYPSKHILIIFCKNSQSKTIHNTKFETLFQADFVDDTNSRIIIFVDTFFLYDFIFQSLKDKFRGENYNGQTATHKIFSEFKVKLEIPDEKVIRI